MNRGQTANKPVIVLVRPQLGENIGKAARAMLNFGLTEMRLVAPRDGWPNPNAGPAAAGADIVLADAKVYDSTAEAVADCTHVFATTVRKRGVTKPVFDAEQAAAAMANEAQGSGTQSGKSAILFGPERSGLETDDVALARSIITVPINPEFGSLNLAQAVILIAYAWSRTQTGAVSGGEALAQPTRGADDAAMMTPAPQAELDGMIEQLFSMLDARDYFYPPDRTSVTKRTLQTLMTQPGWNEGQVRTMRGILRYLNRPPKQD